MRGLLGFLIGLVLLTSNLYASAPPIGHDDIDYSEQLDGCATVKFSSGGTTNYGSCYAFLREDVDFAWTAAHVVERAKKVEKVLNLTTGKNELKITYSDVELIREVYQNGRKVGTNLSYAKVIRFSGLWDNGHDLALLKVHRKGFFPKGFEFEDSKHIPKVGTKFGHIGSRAGIIGHNMTSVGWCSTVGILRNVTLNDDLGANSRIFDLFTCTSIKHGCSGGVLFNHNNRKVVGTVTQILDGETQNVGLVVPTRRMYQFAKETNCLWALDRNIELPSLEELDIVVSHGTIAVDKD